MNRGQTERICIVSAGSAGLAVAKELLDCGIAFDCLERDDKIGGIWNEGVYDLTHLISSRDTTAFDGFPMPCDYPDFPSREQSRWFQHRGRHDHLGYRLQYFVSFPFLDHKFLEWEQGVPKRLAVATLAPGIANLYFNGLVTPRGGNQPIQ